MVVDPHAACLLQQTGYLGCGHLFKSKGEQVMVEGSRLCTHSSTSSFLTRDFFSSIHILHYHETQGKLTSFPVSKIDLD